MDLPELTTFNHSLEGANDSFWINGYNYFYILWNDFISFLTQYRIVDIIEYCLLGTFIYYLLNHYAQSMKKRLDFHSGNSFTFNKSIKLQIYFFFSLSLFSYHFFCLEGAFCSLFSSTNKYKILFMMKITFEKLIRQPINLFISCLVYYFIHK